MKTATTTTTTEALVLRDFAESGIAKNEGEDTLPFVRDALDALEKHLRSECAPNSIAWTEEMGKSLFESFATFVFSSKRTGCLHGRAMRVTSLAIRSSRDKEVFKECLSGLDGAKKLFVSACLKKLSGGERGGVGIGAGTDSATPTTTTTREEEDDMDEASAIEALVSLCCDAKAITKTFLVNKLNVDVKTSSVRARVNACKVIQEICDKSSLSWDCTNAVKKLKQLLLLSDDDAERVVKEASLRACVALRNSRVDDFTERQEIERALLETNGMSPKTRKELERAFEGGEFVTATTRINKKIGDERLLEMRSPINPNESTPARRLRKQSERLQKFQSADGLPKEAFLTLSASKSKQKQEAEESALDALECTQHTLETIAMDLHQTSSEWEQRVFGCKKIVKLCSLQNNKFRQFCKDASIVLRNQNGSVKKFGETNAILNIIDRLSYAVYDKRSAVARAGCQAVSSMAQRLKGDLSDEFLDILLPSLFKAVVVSVGVISDSGDACVSDIIRNCFGGSNLDDEGPKVHLARVFAEEIVTSKVSKIAKLRAKCALYLSQCFEVGFVGSSHLPQPVAEVASVAIEKALKDADATVRGNAKLAYEKFHRVVEESYFDAFSQQLGPEIKKRLALASSSEKKKMKNTITGAAGNERTLQEAMREQKRKLQQEQDEQKENSRGELTEVIERNAILAAQNNMKAYNDRIGQPVDDDFTIDLPPRMLSIQTPMSIKPALKKNTALVEEASRRAMTTAAAATTTTSARMSAIKEGEFDADVDAENFEDNNSNNSNNDDSIDSSLPPRERLGRSLAQAEVADSPTTRAKAAERLRDALEDTEQLLSKNTTDDVNDVDDKESVESISADFLLRAATTLARFCADDVTESRCFVPALEAIVALTNVSSLRIRIASTPSSAMEESSNNSFMKEFRFAFAESTKILAGPLFGRLAGQNPNARTSAREALLSLAHNVDLETGLLPSLRRAFVSIEATESDMEKCDRARTGVAQFSEYALSTKNLSKKKIAHLAAGSDELKNWMNTLAKCASRCVSVSSKSDLYDACVDALRVVCFEIDQETVEKIVANFESIRADVLSRKPASVPEKSSKKKTKKTKKASSTTPENIDGTAVGGGDEENDASTSLAGRTPGACLDKSTGRSRKSFGTRKTPVSTINTDNSIPMTISPSPILAGGDAATRMNMNDINNTNNNEASFGLDVSQMNNLMPPTTVKKNLLLTKMSGQHSSVVKSAAPTPGPDSPHATSSDTAPATNARLTGKPQTKSLGVGARVMRALDCLKKEENVSTNEDRKEALCSLLEMVHSEYAAFKPFVTLLAPTCVKVAEMDSDGVCRFYARRVLFQAFENVTDGLDGENEESAIVDAATSLVPIFVDETTQTSLRCLKLLLEKVTRKESVEKILDLVGSYVYEKAGVHSSSLSSSSSSSGAKREACECVAIALSKLCSGENENEENEEELSLLDVLLKRDLYSLNVFGDVEKKVIAAIAKALKKNKKPVDEERQHHQQQQLPSANRTGARLVRV